MPAEHPDALLVTAGGTRCAVCGAPASAGPDLGAYRLFSCQRCGCWCSNALAAGAATSFAPERYFDNAGADQPKWAALLERLAQDGLRVGQLLDVGCGSGSFLKFAAERLPGVRLAGLELDPGRAREAQAANPAAVIQAGDATTLLQASRETYDLITLWDVFEHVPAPAALLTALSARLAPGGRIFIQTIHEDSIVPFLGRLSYRLTGGALRRVARRTHDAHHLVFFSRQGIALLAGNAGLLVRDTWFDRLALARMDGGRLTTLGTSLLLRLENLWGNGLFINVILAADDRASRARR